MARLAFLTIGVLHEPEGPQVQGFFDRIEANFNAAEQSEGYLDRSIVDEETGKKGWGNWVAPQVFQKDEFLNRRPATLSLWQDLESVFAFAYNGPHAEALSKRREWFVKGDWPTYVAWWVEDDHTPTWQEASEKLDMLHQHGPTYEAFSFKQPFGPDGQPVQIDREVIKLKSAQYKQER